MGNSLFDNMHPDPRVKGWPFVDSPKFTLCMVSAYLFFSVYLGPKLMHNRKAFSLKKCVIFYNFFHALVSAYIFISGGFIAWFYNYNWFCEPENLEVNEQTMDAVYHTWLFYLSRYIEFLDTIFFILHKKNNHVSILHVVHHSLVPIIAWMGVKYAPGGHHTFPGWINTFVHIIMYTYYMLAAMGPNVKKYLWWKKYITILQLAQFILVILHTINTLFSSCNVQKWFSFVILAECILFFYLFMTFYLEEYSNKKNTKKVATVPFYIKVDNFICNLFSNKSQTSKKTH